MRLIQFQSSASAGRRIGIDLDGEKVIDLNAFDASLPCGMREFLEGGDATLMIAKRCEPMSTRHFLLTHIVVYGFGVFPQF